MEKFDVVIVGGGASGCYTACLLNKNFKIAVVDANTTLAKKILVTGNGKCNLTNKNLSSKYYNQNIDNFLSKHTFNDTIKFFSDIGIETYCDEEGRCYPITNSAKSVVKAINNKLKHVHFFAEHQFLKIEQNNGLYNVITDKTTLNCKYVVVATGNYQTLENLTNLQIPSKPFIPSLVALKTKQNTKLIDGVRVNNVKAIAIQNNVEKTQIGEVLFKDNGLSGICVFNLSCLFARNNAFNGKVIIDLLPTISTEQTKKILIKNSKIFETEDILTGIVDEKLAKYILKLVEKDNLVDNLVEILHNLTFDITDCYNNNQVKSGGVKLTALTQNLESINNTNLFFVGEVCDVDGECGGYNLQWAFTSSKIVADYININKEF